MIPDVSAESDWRWADPSGQQRLVRTDELRAALASGVIAPNTPVWRAGWKEWLPAQDVPELTTSALSAANGVVPNIPPPPLAVVAVQRAYEGDTGTDSATKQAEPPPPPSYVPTPARPQPGIFHTPTHPIRPQPIVPVAPASTPKPVSVKENAPSPDGSAGLAALEAHLASRVAARAGMAAPPARSFGDDPHERQTVPGGEVSLAAPGQFPAPAPAPAPVVATAPIVLTKLVRSSVPPPLLRKSSKPPPPKPMSRPPPPVKHASPEVIEELSGSVLLTDGSGQQKAIEELSGSVLLSDVTGTQVAIQAPAPAAKATKELSGSMLMADLSGPSPVVPPEAPQPRGRDELSASFLLDAGSTGALPSVESTGRILAAKEASRAPFAAELATPPLARPAPFAAPAAAAPVTGGIADQTGTVPKVIPPDDPSDLAATIVKPPMVVGLAPVAIGIPLAAPPPSVEPFQVPSGPIAPPQPVMTTMIGVPPSPELAALQQLQRATALTPTPPPMSPPATSEPLPPPDRSTALLHDFRSISPNPGAKFLIPALAVLGGLVVLGMIGLVIGAVRKKPSEEALPVSTAHASASPSPQASAKAASAAPSASASTPSAALGAACALGGVAHVIAPRAVVQSGVEVDVVGGRLGVGFATRDRDGIAVQLDPTSLAATKTVRAHLHAPDTIRRLVPIVAGGAFAAAADADRANDALLGRRTLAASSPFDLGAAGGGVAWAPYKSNEADVIWKLDGDTPVEAIRAAPLDAAHEDAGWAIAFRRGTSIYAGAANGGATFTPKGPLVKIDGLGPQVGSPTVAAQDGAVLVAWADRAQPSDPWALRWVRFVPGDATADAKAFVPSEGGLGEHAMSPAIAAAGQGRYVLVWTEGPVSNHQVRAQTISGSGAPIGTAMAISDSGVNAGQAQLAILPDGHGVVASLASSGTGPKAAYEVLATPIVCP